MERSGHGIFFIIFYSVSALRKFWLINLKGRNDAQYRQNRDSVAREPLNNSEIPGEHAEVRGPLAVLQFATNALPNSSIKTNG
jgi:hypothetical protein